MSNSIALAQKYVPILDEVYKYASKTSILDATQVQFVNANTVKVFKTSMDGMGNYARNSGFVDGSVTASWETMQLSKDRGRSFMVDAMDNEETIGMAFGTLAGEFIRTKVAPEVDAYRFAKLAGTSNILTAGTAADVTVGTTDIPGLVDAGDMKMNEEEVPQEGRILFISETAYAGLKAKITRQIMNRDGNINDEVEFYNGMRVIRVPQSRFYTAITLYDGTTGGQTGGGYVGTATTGYKLNFMIVHPSAVCQVLKHAVPRIFAPDVNQKADAWKFDYRVYHDIFVYDNKVKGICIHRGSTALS